MNGASIGTKSPMKLTAVNLGTSAAISLKYALPVMGLASICTLQYPKYCIHREHEQFQRQLLL